MTITTDLGSKTLDELTGLHEDSQTTLKDLQDSLQMILAAITGLSNDGGNGMSENVGDQVKEMVGNEDAKEEKGTTNNMDGKPAKVSGKIKFSDLSGLSMGAAMGALLINSTLLELKASMESMLRQIIGGMPSGKQAAKIAKQQAKAEKANKKISAPDPKAFKDLAESLKIFAKAAVMMSLIPKPIVKKATESFAMFIDRMVEIANKMGKNLRHFQSFANGIKTIISSLKNYAVAIILLALTLPLAPLALLNVAFMSLMISMLGKVGEIAKTNAKFIRDVAKSMIMMGIAFILYGIAMLILINVGKHFKEAMMGLLAMVAFLGLVILIGFLCLLVTASLIGAVLAFLLLGVAMIIFAVAIKIMEHIHVKQEAVENVMNAIRIITTAFASMLGDILGAFISILLFLLFAVLFTVAMLVFNLGLLLLVLTDFLMDLITDDGQNFPVIEKIKGLAAQFSDKETMKTFGLGIISVLLFAIFAILLLIGVLAITISVILLFVIDFILEKITDEEDGKIRPIKGMVELTKQMAENTGWWLLGVVAMIPAVLFAGELMVFAILAAIATAFLVAVKENIDKLGNIDEINEVGKKLSEAGIGIMLGFLGVKHKPGAEITIGDMLVGGKNAIKMAAVGAEAVLAIAPMALFMTAAKSIGESFVSLSKSMEEVDERTVEMVFGALSVVMESLADVAESFKGQSAKSIKAIGECVKNVAEALNMITDVVLKLKDGIPEEQIDAACAAMLQICERLFGRPGQKHEEGRYTLCDTLEAIANADLKKINIEAVQSIAPLMDGIDRMADLVVKLADTDVFSEEAITTGVENLGRFLEAMGAVSTAMMSLVKKEGTGERQKKEGFLGWLGFTSEVMKSPLEAVQEVENSGFFSSFENVVEGMKKAGQSLNGFDVGPVENVVKFLGNSGMAELSLRSEDFVTGLTNFDKGLSKLKDAALKRFQTLIKSLSDVGTDSFRKGLENLIKLGQNASQFQRVADAMSEIADAMSQMASKKKDLVAIYEAIAKSHVSEVDLKKTPTNASQAVGGVTTRENAAIDIYALLWEWNENGVPVQAEINRKSNGVYSELEPKPVGNRTNSH